MNSSEPTRTNAIGAAATAFPDATDVACDILAQGGNAIDAAVAAALALSVCEPSGSGLGGQTSLMVHLAEGRSIYLDGHSVAPLAASLDSIQARAQRLGHRACTVPSTVSTLNRALLQFGTWRFEDVIAPAIKLARDGFKITSLQRRQAQWSLSSRYRGSGRRPRVLRKQSWLDGRKLKQPRLAKTLERLARRGALDFYHGEVAHDIEADQRENGGLIRQRDLERLTLPQTRKPVSIFYRGFEIVTTPPPGGGLQLLLALKLLERLYVPAVEPSAEDWYEAIALATFSAFDEREKFPIHPDDFTPSVQDWVLGDARADELAGRLSLERQLATIPDAVEGPGETTHLCVADSHGNVVSLTQSIQSLFGALAANWKLGFIYNNYLSTCTRYRHPYQLGSRCLPRSNAAPTLVFKDGELLLTLGAAGSRRIISSVLQVISRVLDLGMPLPEAVAAPRVHAVLNGQISVEKPAASEACRGRLQHLFDVVKIRRKHSFTMGGVQALRRRPADDGLDGAADPRRDGTTKRVGS